MSSWTGLDFFIFFIFFLNTILGMARGATKEIISTMCLSIALIFLIKFTVPLSNFMDSSPTIKDVINTQIFQNFMVSIGAPPLSVPMIHQLCYVISILVCFVGAFTTGEAVLSFTGIVEVYPFPFAALNRKVGASLGFLRGYVLAVVFVLILQNLYVGKLDKNSFFVNLFNNTATKLDGLISGQNPDRYREIFKDKDLYREKDIYNTVDTQVRFDTTQSQA